MSQENKDEVNVLIIGNGLDISLDYPTKYGDFLNFCEMMQSIYEFVNHKLVAHLFLAKEFDRFIYRYQSELDRKTGEQEKELDKGKFCFWEKFKSLFVDQNAKVIDHLWKLIIDNIWIEYFQKIYIDRTIRGENWIDLEEEIRNVILEVEKNKDVRFSVVDTRAAGYSISISTVLERISHPVSHRGLSVNENEEIFRNFSKKARIDYDRFIVALDIYLDFFVSRLDSSNSKKIKQLLYIEDVVDYIICFNYKNNFTRGYSVARDIETCMVHGKLQYSNEIKNNDDIEQLVNNNNMVIGFQDDSDEVKDLTFVYYRKYFQRIVKGTGNAYLSWFNEAERTNKRINVYVVGHSLGSMDADVFRTLFYFPHVHFTIFYYTDGKNTDLESKVLNLMKMLGKDDVIKFTSGQDPVIKFEEQRYSNE